MTNTVRTVNTLLLNTAAASYLWSHAWLKPGQEPKEYLPGTKSLERLMRRGNGAVDAEGWRHAMDGDLCRFPTVAKMKEALTEAGLKEGVDFKDGKPTEVIYVSL